MIEYYQKFFPKNYNKKVSDLIKDLEKLLEIESIPLITTSEKPLSNDFKENLKNDNWDKINQIYYTLYQNEEHLPAILKKFINKKNSSEDYSFIDTFSGCGGLSLGLLQAGFKPILINEINSKFLETYYFNHDIDLKHYFCNDIKDFLKITEFQELNKKVDLIVGGPPCQGFSTANRQRILSDPRNILYKYFLDLLSSVKPKFFLMENVKGMMNKKNEIINDFNQIIGKDYTTDILLLNAKNFGIPQNRERVFVIGSSINEIPAHSISKDILNNISKISDTNLNDALYGLPELKPKRIKNNNLIENEDYGFKYRKIDLNHNDYTKEINLNYKFNYLCNHVNRFNNDRDITIFDTLPMGANSLHESIKEIMPYNTRNHIFKDKYFKLNSNKVSKTITSHMKFDCNMYIHPTQARGISPREAARIQSFPDDYVFMGSNNSWYEQIGNAVPVKLAKHIGENFIKHLK